MVRGRLVFGRVEGRETAPGRLPYHAPMRFQRSGRLWVPQWVLWAGLFSWLVGLVLIGIGVWADIAGWWTGRPFMLNLTSSLASALVGIPVSILALSWVLERTRVHRAGVSLHARAITALSAIADASAHAIADDVSGTASKLLTLRLSQSELVRKYDLQRDDAREADSSSGALTRKEHNPQPELQPSPDPSVGVRAAERTLSERARPFLEYRQDQLTCRTELDRLLTLEATCAGQGVAFLPVDQTMRLKADIDEASYGIGLRGGSDQAVSASAVHLGAINALEWARSNGWPARKRTDRPTFTDGRPSWSLPAPLSVVVAGAVLAAGGLALMLFGLRQDGSGLWVKWLFTMNVITATAGAMVGIPVSVLFLSAVLERTREHRVQARIQADAIRLLQRIADLAAQALGSDVDSAGSAQLDERLTAVLQVDRDIRDARYQHLLEEDGTSGLSAERAAALQVATSRGQMALAERGRSYVEYVQLGAAFDGARVELTQLEDVAEFEGLTELTDLDLGGVKVDLRSICAAVKPVEHAHLAPIAAAQLYARVQACLTAAVAAGWAVDTATGPVPGPVSGRPQGSRARTAKRHRVRVWSSQWPSSWPGTEDTNRAESYVVNAARLERRSWTRPGVAEKSRPSGRSTNRGARRLGVYAALGSRLAVAREHANRWMGERISRARRSRGGRLVLHPITVLGFVSVMLLALFGPSR